MLVNKKEKMKKKQEQILTFLKGRNGRLLMAGCAVFLVLLICFVNWNRGSIVRNGLALCEKGEYAEAQTWFKNAIIADNMNPDNYNYLGMAYLGSGRYEDAGKQFQLALNLDEENQAAYRGLGITALKTGLYEDSIAYFNKALDYAGMRISQTEYDILWYRSDAEKAMGDYKAASKTYSALLELEGDTALIRYYRGDAYCQLGKKKKAVKDFDAAVAMNGNGYDLFWNIYDSMSNAGWSKEAEAYLHLTEQPGYVDQNLAGSGDEARKYQGMIAYICGDYEEAIERLSSESLKKDEQAQIYLALAYEKNEDSAKALSIYLEQTGDAGADSSDYNRIARYFIRQNQGQQAVTYLQQGIKSFEKDDLEDLYYNMVTAYESYGDYEEALNALKEYTSLYGETDASDHELAFLKERIQ